MARTFAPGLVCLALTIACAACVGGAKVADELFGVVPVKKCLLDRHVRVQDFGRELLVLGGPGAQGGSGTLSFFRTRSAAEAKTRERRGVLGNENPVWTNRNLSWVGLGPGVHGLVTPCLGKRELVATDKVMAGVGPPPTVVVGAPAKILPAAAVSRGWKTVTVRSGRKSLQIHVTLKTRRFRAFAVSLTTRGQARLDVVAGVTCILRDGGAGSEPVRFSGTGPVVLGLLSGRCTSALPPDVFIQVRLDRAETVTVRLLMR